MRTRNYMRSRLNLVKDWPGLTISANYRIDKLAKNCGVSPRQLERFFHQELGKSPREWLTEARLTQAMTCLKEGSTVKETSFNLGYKQVSHFSREFKRFHGLSPAEVQRGPQECQI